MFKLFFLILGKGRNLKKCVDVVGIFLHLLVVSLYSVVLLALPFIFLNIDPICLSINLFSSAPDETPGTLGSYTLLAFRLGLITLLIYAICRSVSFVMVWAILLLKILLHCTEISGKRISIIWNNSNAIANFHNHLNLYQSLYLIVSGYVGVFTSPFAIAIMGTGLGLEIATVFTIIRLRGLIQVSWPVYCGCIIMAVVVPVLADIQLPEAIRIFDNAEDILRKWKIQMTLAVRGDKRYYFKKIASLRPCSLYAGLGNVVFYPLRKSTKATYYGLMIYYVITALISVPESARINIILGR
jgi:hypothetical protein